MSDTGVKYPGTIAGGFSNSANVAADDNNYATVAPASFDTGYPQHKDALLYYNSGTIGSDLGDNSQLPTSETQKEFGGALNVWGATLTSEIINDSSFGVTLAYASTASAFYGITCTNFGFAIPTGATINGVLCQVSDYYVSSRVAKTIYLDYVRLIVYYTEGGGPSFVSAWARNSNSIIKVM